MKASALVVRAFDAYRRQVIGEIDLPIHVGPHLFTITFQVMDINHAYSCLLGRPWIHADGAVTSTMHHKLNFMVEDNLVIIYSKDDLLISELSSFRYVETDEGTVEAPFQYLEFEDVSTTTSNLDKVSEVIMSSLKNAKETLEKVNPVGWRQVINVSKKNNCFGIDYYPSSSMLNPGGQKKSCHVKEVFESVGFQHDDLVEVIGDASGEIPSFVRQCPHGFTLNN